MLMHSTLLTHLPLKFRAGHSEGNPDWTLKISKLEMKRLAAALAVHLCTLKSEDPNKPRWMSRSVDMRDPRRAEER
jgi:hypothetical protein